MSVTPLAPSPKIPPIAVPALRADGGVALSEQGALTPSTGTTSQALGSFDIMQRAGDRYVRSSEIHMSRLRESIGGRNFWLPDTVKNVTELKAYYDDNFGDKRKFNSNAATSFGNAIFAGFGGAIPLVNLLLSAVSMQRRFAGETPSNVQDSVILAVALQITAAASTLIGLPTALVLVAPAIASFLYVIRPVFGDGEPQSYNLHFTNENVECSLVRRRKIQQMLAAGAHLDSGSIDTNDMGDVLDFLENGLRPALQDLQALVEEELSLARTRLDQADSLGVDALVVNNQSIVGALIGYRSRVTASQSAVDQKIERIRKWLATRDLATQTRQAMENVLALEAALEVEEILEYNPDDLVPQIVDLLQSISASLEVETQTATIEG